MDKRNWIAFLVTSPESNREENDTMITQFLVVFLLVGIVLIPKPQKPVKQIIVKSYRFDGVHYERRLIE